MPRIFDNMHDEQHLLPALKDTLQAATHADFCVGYFNLRGWAGVADAVEQWDGGEGHQARVMVGMQNRPEAEFRLAMNQHGDKPQRPDNASANQLRKRLAGEFRDQLTVGVPTNADEATLRQLAQQLRDKKVVVKLFIKHRLHAKLYLAYLESNHLPRLGYLGSSNLTLSGLQYQGELNIDVPDSDTTQKLAAWFEDLWNNKWCIDISEELADIIETSWARTDLISPYHIYIKMAYHLSHEARMGLSEFRIPAEFDDILFDFQKAAVKIAAHHLNKRDGVMIGDVVGLGKSLMATTLAAIFDYDFGMETLIICPKNLETMWRENYVERYGLRAKVLPITRAVDKLPDLKRYHLVIIDESHNLRNRDGKRYKAVQDYLRKNDSKCILLSATPYNKTYLDLSNQLRLFVPEDRDLGIRPEQLLQELGETEFIRRHQAGLRTLAAFEKSEHTDDWRELMRLFMVRRTRSFIKNNYAEQDPERGNRYYLEFADGRRNYFPARIPKTVTFPIHDPDHDPYARLYADSVVTTINGLELPRYGLGQYVNDRATKAASKAEQDQLDDLSRAGKRLIGFSRTNLFKRLESSGYVFLQSIQRHILRNYIYLHAIENGLDLPIGTQDIAMLDMRNTDDGDTFTLFADGDDDDLQDDDQKDDAPLFDSFYFDEATYKKRAAEIYDEYIKKYKRRFKWLPSFYFTRTLTKHLKADVKALQGILENNSTWNPNTDQKLLRLLKLLTDQHPNEKILVFTQFADTVRYLEKTLGTVDSLKGQLAGVTGGSSDPTVLAHRFSPNSNNKRIPHDQQLRVLVATDVLSEGQNLQDGHIIVNYDLTWTIIRLIQRAGRVDRIGQQSDHILVYTFVPSDGVEQIIRLRSRVRQRLDENAEVVGTDESFFEDESDRSTLLDLYHERATLLDDDDSEGEVDLASYAYQIWQNALKRDKSLERVIMQMPMVSYSAREHRPTPIQPEGVLTYMRTTFGNDIMVWVAPDGRVISESQYEILNAARCHPDTPALERADYHHEAVAAASRHIIENVDNAPTGGQLGRPSGARFRTYERLKAFGQEQHGTLFYQPYVERGLYKAIEEIYKYPLQASAKDTLNRQLRSGIQDDALAELVINLRDDDRLCIIHENPMDDETRIICTLGLRTDEF